MHRQKRKMKAVRQSLFNDQIEKETSKDPPVDEIELPTLKTKLRDWANTYRISKRALDSLLSILNSSGITSVPKNHRTLLETPLNVGIKEISRGKYWHNGLEKCLRLIFSTLNCDISISLSFNIDGVPLYKSSKISFWPILASIFGKMMTPLNNPMRIVKSYLNFRNATHSTNGNSDMVWFVKTSCIE